MIVVDTNIIAYLLIRGEQTLLARRVWDIDSDWRVPILWRHEFLNVLANAGKFRKTDFAVLAHLWTDAQRLLSHAEHDVDMLQALQLAVLNQKSAYDAHYVALAADLDVPLITEDRRLRQSFPDRCLSMQGFCESAS